MQKDIPERDWKLFRELHPIALDRFSLRALTQMRDAIAKSGTSHIERFWAVRELAKKQERTIRQLFDDMRRSTAQLQITLIRSHDLWTDEEFSRFSEETQKVVASLLSIGREDEASRE